MTSQADAAPLEGIEHKSAETMTETERDEASKNETSFKFLTDNAQEEKCLPDILEVYDDHPSILLGHEHSRICRDNTIPSRLLFRDVWWRFTRLGYPVKFVRVYPPRIPVTKGDGFVKPRSGWINLQCAHHLGNGSHSDVIREYLVLPCTGTAPGQVDPIAVKLARSDVDMLWTEAKIYNAFPRALQEGSPHTPPVVPKFYGFYVLSEEFDYPKLSGKDRDEVRETVNSQVNFLVRRSNTRTITTMCM